MKKTLILTLILTIGFTFQQCIDCKCPTITQPYFDIQAMELQENIRNYPNLEENTEVDFVDFSSLSIFFEADLVSSAKAPCKHGFSLMNSAYACSCIEGGHEGSKNEYLDNLTIITLNDFDSLHLANSSLNDLWSTYDERYEKIPVNDYLQQDTSKISSQEMTLFLSKAPELDSSFQVKIIAELSTGEVYEAESSRFILLP